MSAGPMLLALVGVLGVALTGLFVYVSGSARNEAIVSRTALDEVEARASRVRARLDTRLRRTRLGRELFARLAAAGVDLTPVDYLGLTLVGAAAAFVVVDALVSRPLAVIVAVAAVRLSWWLVQRRRHQRGELFVSQLPEVARVLSNAASAGLAITTSIEMAAAELDEPAASELRLTADALRVGHSLESALEELGRRLPSRELAVLVSTLVIQHRAGGALVSALRDMADTLDARKDLRREVRTIMAGSVFTGYVVAAMGLGTLLLLNLIEPTVIDQMITSSVGRIAFVVAAALYGLGFALIRRTVRIDA